MRHERDKAERIGVSWPAPVSQDGADERTGSECSALYSNESVEPNKSFQEQALVVRRVRDYFLCVSSRIRYELRFSRTSNALGCARLLGEAL